MTGLGHVGSSLCRQLAGGGRAAGRLGHPRGGRAARRRGDRGAAGRRRRRAHAAEADVFAPCALGAGLNERTIPEIRARLVCGAANNQLATPEDAGRLAARGILYAPDYLVNAGGVISVARGALGLDDARRRGEGGGDPRDAGAGLPRGRAAGRDAGGGGRPAGREPVPRGCLNEGPGADAGAASQADFTSILFIRAFASGECGIFTVSTPFLNEASTLSASRPGGSGIVRKTEP